MSVRCPECGNGEVIRRGFELTRRGRIQKYQCKRCGRVFVPEELKVKRS